MLELDNGTELGVPKVEECKVRLSDGITEDSAGNEWTVEELEEMVTKVKDEIEQWEKLVKWLKNKPE